MLGDVPVILRYIEVQPGNDAYLLDFATIRMAKKLPLCDLNGNESELTFSDSDPRPADRAAALLDIRSRCLHIQENSSVISFASAGKYLRTLDASSGLRFNIVMDGDAQARMLKSGGFKRLSIGLADLGNVHDLTKYGFSDADILKLTSGMEATQLNISFGVERKRGDHLNIEKVIEIASGLLALPAKHLRSLRVVPVNVDEEGLAIDLVNDRIIFKESITAVESEELPDAVRYRAVNGAWRKYRDVLRERYDPQ